MRELPEPDLGFAHKSYSPDTVLAIQKQAYEDGLRDARQVPQELFDLFSFMKSAFVPMTPQQQEIQKQLDITAGAMLAASQKESQ